MCEELLLNLDGASPKLREQLTSRHYKKSNSGGRIFLEPKPDAKADGRPSPDRADALVLSYTGLIITDFLRPENVTVDERIPVGRAKKVSYDELETVIDDMTFGGTTFESPEESNPKRVQGSLAVAAGFKQTKPNKYGYN
jgi:hypothetical protein